MEDKEVLHKLEKVFIFGLVHALVLINLPWKDFLQPI
jgi:hypothetical protein